MTSKLTPPISSPTNSQAWMLWHKDLGQHLNLLNSIKSQKISDINQKLRYNINGAMMNIQYYGPASTTDAPIVVALPVECSHRSVVSLTYSDGSQSTVVIESNAKTLTIPTNTKELTDKNVHIQGQVFIVVKG